MTNESEKGFWANFPGILTGIASILGAGGVVAMINNINSAIPSRDPKPPVSSTPVPGSSPETGSSETGSFFVIGAQSGYRDKLRAHFLTPNLKHFPRMNVCKSTLNPPESEPYYLVVGEVSSRSEAEKLKEAVIQNGSFPTGTYIKAENETPFNTHSCGH